MKKFICNLNRINHLVVFFIELQARQIRQQSDLSMEAMEEVMGEHPHWFNLINEVANMVATIERGEAAEAWSKDMMIQFYKRLRDKGVLNATVGQFVDIFARFDDLQVAIQEDSVRAMEQYVEGGLFAHVEEAQ